MLDTLPIPDRFPVVEQLKIKQILGQPREYTTELLRLFLLPRCVVKALSGIALEYFDEW